MVDSGVHLMTDQELVMLIEHVRVQTGINLDESKRYLLESRLSPILQNFSIGSYTELLERVAVDSSIENQALINAITTNETYFFRDGHPFDLLKNKLIPDLLKRNQNKIIKIASAACSSGQEAYSMAMVLKETLFDLSDSMVEIRGFDISSKVVTAARRGEYSKFEVQRGLSEDRISRYFDCVNGRYQVKPELRSIVTFGKQNLLKPLSIKAEYHIIFCRNVVNYFEDKDRALLFQNLASMLVPCGVLVIGSTEFINDKPGNFIKKNEQGSVYYEKVG